MGHANIEKNFQFIIDHLVKNESATISELVDTQVQKKMYVSTSEGRYYQDYMLRMITEEIFYFLRGLMNVRPRQNENVVVPVRLSKKQREALDKWEENEEDLEEEDYDVFESIRWRLAAKYRKDRTKVPIITNITN